MNLLISDGELIPSVSGVASQGPTGAEPLDRSEDKSDKTNGLRGPLLESAKAMLSEFLRRTRHSRRKGGGSRGVDSRKLDMVRDASPLGLRLTHQVIDTTLAKLLAETGNIPELLALLAAPNDCVLSEIEPFLLQRPYVLSTVMRRQGRHVRVLELLQQCVSAENCLCHGSGSASSGWPKRKRRIRYVPTRSMSLRMSWRA